MVGIAAVIRRVDKPTVTVGVDGGVYRFHPQFSKVMTKTINDLLQDKKYKVVVCLTLFFSILISSHNTVRLRAAQEEGGHPESSRARQLRWLCGRPVKNSSRGAKLSCQIW